MQSFMISRYFGSSSGPFWRLAGEFTGERPHMDLAAVIEVGYCIK